MSTLRQVVADKTESNVAEIHKALKWELSHAESRLARARARLAKFGGDVHAHAVGVCYLRVEQLKAQCTFNGVSL